tara:strand:- start:280 stop:444 length:165 start_codon:yes stop_codon:yes gene_type:complete
VHGEVIFISDERELSSAFSQIFKDDIEHASIIFGNVWLRRSVFLRIAQFVGSII